MSYLALRNNIAPRTTVTQPLSNCTFSLRSCADYLCGSQNSTITWYYMGYTCLLNYTLADNTWDEAIRNDGLSVCYNTSMGCDVPETAGAGARVRVGAKMKIGGTAVMVGFVAMVAMGMVVDLGDAGL